MGANIRNVNTFVQYSFLLYLCFLSAQSSAAPGKTELCLVKDNKQAAVVLTTDDGLLKSVQYFVSQWKIYGLRGTVAIIANSTGNWQPWIDMVNEGYLDIGNHSLTHKFLPDLTVSELKTEINNAQAVIEKNIPGYKVITFLCPEGAYSDQVVSVIEEQHAANRVVDRGYNSFSPTNREMYRLKRQQILGATAVSEMNGWIDQAISQKRWLIEAFHGCDDQGWEPPPCSRFPEHYAYIKSKSSQIWCGTFQEVIKYIKERMCASVTVVSATTTGIQLSLSDTLPNDAYNFPLTLKTEVPAGWDRVTIIQATDTQSVASVNESGILSVFFEALPDKGSIILSKEGQTPLVNPLQQHPANTSTPNTVLDAVIYTIQGKKVTSIDATQKHPKMKSMNNGMYILYYPKEQRIERVPYLPGESR